MNNTIKALLILSLLAVSSFSQATETAYVPVVTNVAAKVSIQPNSTQSGTGTERNLAAGVEDTLEIQLNTETTPTLPQSQIKTAAVRYEQGRVFIELNPQSFKNADISLFNLNGKRILHGKAYGTESVNISQSNISEGIYLLLVKGANGNSHSARLMHRGGTLNINATFSGGSQSISALAKAGDYGTWKITATADGYIDTSYAFEPDTGTNPLQTITLNPIETDTRATLAAGSAVNAAFDATNASVTFTGASGLTLSAADFIVSGGLNITNVAVAENIATVTVALIENIYDEPQTYTVSIDPNSTLIKGDAQVTITQAANPGGETDTRATLAAGPAVNAAYDAVSANVTFTGASGLTLSAADFIVSGGLNITNVAVAANTVTVTVALIENPYDETETYTVHINEDSEKIKGTASVTITQAANPGGIADERVELTTEYPQEIAFYNDASSYVSFESTTNLTLTAADFTVSAGATIGSVYKYDSEGIYYFSIQINFGENSSYDERHFTVGINSTSTKIKGNAEVVITQAGKPYPLTDFSFISNDTIVLPSKTGEIIGAGYVGAQQWAQIGTFGSEVGGTPSYYYSLISGAGDTDNALFDISYGILAVNSADLTEAREYSIRVQVESGIYPVTDDQKFAKVVTFNVGYPPAGIPSASASGTISAEVGGKSANAQLAISLSNATLIDENDGGPETDDDLSSWFNPSVAGLKYTLTRYGNYLVVAITGTPTALPTSSNVTITIPKEILLDRHGYPSITQDLVVTGSVSYDITVNVAKIGETTYTSLQSALDNAVDGDVIKIINDIELSSTVNVFSSFTRSITLQADEGTRTIKAAPGFEGTLFNIGSAETADNNTLNFGNGNGASHSPTLIIDGNNTASNLISMGSTSSRGGKINLYNGVEVRNASYNAVYVSNSSRQGAAFDFVMHGGVIAGNYQGVSIYAPGSNSMVASFTMNGGIIYGTDAVGGNANITAVAYEGNGASVKFIGDDTSTTSSSEVKLTTTLGTAP